MNEIYGIEIDTDGRCYHYHQQNDIVGLKCQRCNEYFACYKCHDNLRDHSFVSCDKNDYPAICGKCRKKMTFDDYKNGYCPSCHAGFNPNCHLHWDIYFK
ncbi:CHY zinc finger protein [Lactobacillus sp. UCMA15818]|uniref:CHY zinc finger protein n=1 Tax=Lactobacillus sp. UCMA15818 TaxID=2583394 RepID=UPI0025AF109C|nr:CHY zinc finger protein [Lactobacillus sp. UCMA15818]MDN2452207.1 hypothetical protein [Lactobacillus sp. UCMA15818]